MNNEKYEILEHPAELRLRIYGKTIEELFINAAEAMANILSSKFKEVQPPKVNRQYLEVEPLKIESIDINSLLVDFLSEILAKSQINKSTYLVSNVNCQMSDVKAELKATLIGYPVDHFDEDIKAVTYQDLNIQKINGIWQTVLVFDI